MTAQELHIDYDINLQKINSNFTRNIEPEEKDWLLNKGVTRFLNNVTRDIADNKRRGFQEDTKRLKDIDALIKTVTLNVEQIEDKRGKVILPSFNFKHLKASAIYYKDCEASKGEENQVVKNVFSFKLPESFINDLKIQVTYFGQNNLLYNTDNLPLEYRVDDPYYLTKSFIITLRQALLTSFYDDIEIYHEWFGDTYKENTFYIVGNSKLGGVTLKSNTGTTTHTVDFKTYKEKRHVSDKEIKKPVRITSSEDIHWKEDSYLSGSIAESPLMEITKGEGFIGFPPNAIVKQVILTYICKPYLIDVSLGTSLNLDADICAEIVLETTRFTKALLDSGNYEKYFNETNLIE